jgi:guanine deaminase
MRRGSAREADDSPGPPRYSPLNLPAGRGRDEDAGVTLALRGRILTPLGRGGLEYLPDGLVRADDDGRITEVSAYPKRGVPVLVRDMRPALLLPGFVDAHLHFPQTRIIGRASGPLLEWLDESVFPEEARFARPAYARAVADDFIDRMLGAGTTSASIFSSSHAGATHILFERLAARGMRASAGLTLMDQRCPRSVAVPRKEAMAAARKLAARWDGHDGGRLRFAVTPRFALSCSRGLLEDAGKLAAELALPIQTHLGETPGEGEATLAAHPYAQSYLDVYDRAGLVNERAILAHAIHLSKAEWTTVARRRAHLAHCPDSNFFLGSGRMRLAHALGKGIGVALGSDVAAGRSFSMRRAMASAYDNALCLDARVEPAELFRLATLGGASALGAGDRVGSLEPGKECDLVAVSVSPRAKTVDEVLAELVFDNDRVDVLEVYVRGRRLELAPAA